MNLLMKVLYYITLIAIIIEILSSISWLSVGNESIEDNPASFWVLIISVPICALIIFLTYKLNRKIRSHYMPTSKGSKTNYKFNDKITQKIFISYRRIDTADVTGRIYDRLLVKYEKQNIFKDVDSIPLGVDYRHYIYDKVSQCKVLLAVIGSNWDQFNSQTGLRRIDEPKDFLRIEIECAINRNIPIIPILIGNAKIPDSKNLPESLQSLSFRNGIRIRPDPDFNNDMNRLLKGIHDFIQ